MTRGVICTIPPSAPGMPVIDVEINGTDIAILFDGVPVVGLLSDDPECDDPTLVVWASEKHGGGEALLSLHLGKMDFTQDNRTLGAAIAADLCVYNDKDQP